MNKLMLCVPSHKFIQLCEYMDGKLGKIIVIKQTDELMTRQAINWTLDLIHKNHPTAGADRTKEMLLDIQSNQATEIPLDLPSIDEVDVTKVRFSLLTDALRRGVDNSDEFLVIRQRLNISRNRFIILDIWFFGCKEKDFRALVVPGAFFVVCKRCMGVCAPHSIRLLYTHKIWIETPVSFKIMMEIRRQ